MAAGTVLSRPERDLSLARACVASQKLRGSVLIDPADGADCKTTTVRFATHLKQAEGLRDEMKRILVSETSPNLMLNNHCSICEFRQQCHTQAVQEDNLSLIRGIGEKEIKGYGRKGLFTLTQLAYTFRPRRNPKQPDGLSKQRNHSLGLNSTNLNGPVPTGRCRICAGGTWHGYPGTSPTPATR